MNGIICIHKDKEMTSFDVIRQLRRKYNYKFGHSGTLDPNATGLLLVAVNKATKALNYIDTKDKVYVATCQLGLKTDTGDIWGKVLNQKNISSFDETKLKEVLSSFIGPQKQRVPMVSAKKIDGKKLYEYHRENIKLETQYTNIEIFDIELLSMDETSFKFKARVSNGTYIRTLCEDIALKLNNLGTMSSLIRTEIGQFNLDDAISLNNLPNKLKLIPTKDAITLPRVIDHSLEFKVKNGQRITLNSPHKELLIDAGEYYAVYKKEKDNIYKSVRGLW